MDKEDLLKLIQDDDLGLLKTKPKQEEATSDDRLTASFCDINQFVNENGREPTQENGDINEYKLYARLKAIRTNEEKIKALIDLDEHNLLKDKTKEIRSMKDVFEDDDLGILQSDVDNIFNLKNIPKEITSPDYIANRKKCKDFQSFEEKFIQCHKDLVVGKRKLWPFKREQNIEKGYFFVLKGVLVYIADVGDRKMINGACRKSNSNNPLIS